jgi:hypothetical protein
MRGACDLVADARFGMVQERVRLRCAACEHEEKLDDSNQG